MGWIKLDDGFYRHPKVVRAGRDGRDLFIAGLCWCSSQLTDGHIPAAMLPALSFDAGVPVDEAAIAADRLVEVGLWEHEPEGWVVHDYVDHQRTREQVEHDREQARERQARRRTRVTAPSRRDSRPSHSGVTEQESESESESDKRPSKGVGTNLSSSSVGGSGDDDDDRVRSITDEIGARNHARALAAGEVKRNPLRHLATCKANALTEHGDGVAAALGDGATADEVLEGLAPQPTQSRAAAARARRNGAA